MCGIASKFYRLQVSVECLGFKVRVLISSDIGITKQRVN